MARARSAPVAPLQATDGAVMAWGGHVVLPAGGNRWAHLADVFGRLVAQGLDEMEAALAAMRREAAARSPAMDAHGRDMRLAHLLRDAVVRWDAARDRTRFAIRRALGPLLAERRASAELVRAAEAVNEAAGTPLLRGEVLGLVRQEVFWAARRAQREARRQA